MPADSLPPEIDAGPDAARVFSPIGPVKSLLMRPDRSGSCQNPLHDG